MMLTENLENIAIRVQNICKCYTIYAKPHDRLKQFVATRFQQFVGQKQKNYYREFWALKDISFEIKKGETVGIIGPNGCGKSTLLQIICGTLHPTGGCVQTYGRIAALLELGAGFNPEFTGRENVYMNAAVLGLCKEEIDERFDDISTFADIGQFMDQPVKTYSSGMYVRLAFSVAIHVSPDILIIDEALAVGDASFQAKCMRKFEEFRRNGTTILLVTHDLGAVLQFSSRCIVLDSGVKLNVEQPKLAVDSLKKLLISPRNKPLEKIAVSSKRLLELRDGLWSKNYQLNDEGSEIYGNGKASICDIGIFDVLGNVAAQKLQLGEIYTFKMLIQFRGIVSDPIFTLTFRDLTGREVAGTNTRNIGINTGCFVFGDFVEVSFDVETRLAPGSYLLTYACSGYEGNDFVAYERLYHILIIEIYGIEQVVGYFDLKASIKFSKRKQWDHE